MRTLMLYFSIVLLSISLGSKANAITLEFGPAYNPNNGHWYSIYKNDSDIDITWEAAKVLAEAEGGYLATLLTHEEDRFILDTFAGQNILISVRAWIGLSDKDIEGNFQWVTGSEGTQPLNYSHWLPGEPSNSEGEDYVEWKNEPNGYGTNEAWNDVSNNAAGMFRFMVEFDDVPENIITLEFGPAYNPNNGHWYSIYKTNVEIDISWITAEAFAESEGGYLATLLTHEEDRFILDAFAGQNILISVRAWIGLSDKDVEGNFQWVTGSEGTQPLNYSHWLPGEPSNSEGEDYVEWKNEPNGYGTNEAWNDVSNNAAGMFRFMVEFDDVPENIITLEFGPAYNPNNGHWYSIYKTNVETDISWITAEAFAESEGGYLATLLTHEEDRFILDAFAGQNILISVRAWIGLSDKDVEGNFQWVTGSEGTQPLNYSHWLPGEPSNSEGENYVEWKNEPNGYGTNEAWNDVSSNAAGMFRFMVEFETPGHFYVIPGSNGKGTVIFL